MQPQSLTAGSLLSLTWSHCARPNSTDSCTSNNGNLWGQTILAGGQTFSQSFQYDGLNRIVQGAESNGGLGWTQYYVPDRYGNVAIGAPVGGGSSPWEAGSFQTASNQVTGWGYDASGNVTGPGSGTPFATIQYDAESRQTGYQGVSTSAQYIYDAAGRRVQSVVNGATTTYVYDARGNLAAEYGSSTAGAGRKYLTADYLGSTRLVTDVNGAVIERRDYAPYGEEISAVGCGQSVQSPRCAVPGYSTDVGVRQKFTGQERDAETGLDYFGARYFSGAQGRFTSPDPSPNGIAIQDPQSWNLYSYVRSRPLRFVDEGGKWPTTLHGDIITAALQGYVSAGDLKTLIGRQWIMDADQSGGGSFKHAMHGPFQKSQDAAQQMWSFIASGVASGSMEAFGDALHTIQDYTSPEHTDTSFQLRMWPGTAGAVLLLPLTIKHLAGENSPENDWARFGLAVRLTMAAWMQRDPKAAAEAGSTDATFEREFLRRMTNYVGDYFTQKAASSGDPTKTWYSNAVKQDAARQCALGNPAACGF
jgi:RHS repeat-associated protein